jgi:hypothetical protein
VNEADASVDPGRADRRVVRDLCPRAEHLGLARDQRVHQAERPDALILASDVTQRKEKDDMRRSILTAVALLLVLSAAAAHPASAQVMPKAQVANLIVKVENGVDELRKYLDRRAENASDAAGAAKASGRRSKATENQKAKATAKAKKDKLDDALGDLNRSTNRLRRKFDPIDTWMQTKGEVQRVVDDGRTINAEVARGSYGTEVARLWAALRTGINDLARAYGIPPLGL